MPTGKLRWGKRVLDQVTGFLRYERIMVENDYGFLIDPRDGGFDIADSRQDYDNEGR